MTFLLHCNSFSGNKFIRINIEENFQKILKQKIDPTGNRTRVRCMIISALLLIHNSDVLITYSFVKYFLLELAFLFKKKQGSYSQRWKHLGVFANISISILICFAIFFLMYMLYY